jgi:Serine aminopeptidase, S33
MRRPGSIVLILIPLIAGLYFGSGAAILHYGLDDILWPRVSTSEPLPLPTYSSLADGTGSVVRAVGPDTARCVVFFPGHSGGFGRYAHDLFPSLNSAGLQVWAISYPGQDGAIGKARRAAVLSDVQRLLVPISSHCPREHTVFVGRSLGANIAAIAAVDWQPRGLVLEGASASLAAAVRHALARHWYTRMLEVLPIDALVAPDFPLSASVAHFGPRRTTLFQGQFDEVAPPADVEELGPLGVTVHIVAGATHTNAYQLAGQTFYVAVDAIGNVPK